MNLSALIGYQEPKILTYNDKTNPSDKPLLLTVHCTDSKIGKEAMRAMQISIFTMMKDEANIVEVEGVKNLRNDLLNEVGVNYLASLVVGWEGLVDGKGKKVPFDRELLKQAIENSNDLGVEIDKFSKDKEGNFQA